jgi:hypothetical protein
MRTKDGNDETSLSAQLTLLVTQLLLARVKAKLNGSSIWISVNIPNASDFFKVLLLINRLGSAKVIKFLLQQFPFP